MMKKPREFLLYFVNDCFVLHEGTSCPSLGSPRNHFQASCHQIHIKQGHLEAHLGWELSRSPSLLSLGRGEAAVHAMDS